MARIVGPNRFSTLLGMLAALVGFSYALATSSTPDTEAGAVAVRVAGSNPRLPLYFTDPFVNGSTDRDLGDAAIGSMITRYVNARGGVGPRRFTSTRTFLDDDGKVVFAGTKTLGEAIVGLPSSAKPSQSTAVLYLNGLLKGIIGGSGGTVPSNTPLRFDVTCVDSSNKNPAKINETFRITLVDSSTFKFSQSSLNSGIAFRRYFEKLEVIGGNGPFAFSASNITVSSGGVATPYAKLEDLGLFLNKKTGQLVGRPLVAGTYAFFADCVDSKGVHAQGRGKSGVGQVLTFNIDANPRVASELFATQMLIKGDTLGGSNDTIQYSGLLALGDQKVSDLNGLGVTMMIGNYLSPTVTLNGGKGESTGSPKMDVAISSEGLIKITVKGDTFGKDQSIITNDELKNSLKVLSVSVMIDSDTDSTKPAYQSSELLKFKVNAKSSKFQLSYKFGPGNLGGGFIITSVAGKDDKAEKGDAWLVKFVSLPPNEKKLSSFGTITGVTVGIGTDFTNSINATLTKDTVKSTEKRTSDQAAVLKVGYDSKSGKGFTQTGVLPEVSSLPNTQTNISPALNAKGKKSPFPFLITFNDANGKELFGAEGSRKILPKGTSWVNKDLSK